MSDTPHINKWLEGLFKPALEFNEDDIKRRLSQKCIGYQISQPDDQLVASVFQGQVELENGSIKDAWFLQYIPGREHSAIMLDQPRIDIENK